MVRSVTQGKKKVAQTTIGAIFTYHWLSRRIIKIRLENRSPFTRTVGSNPTSSDLKKHAKACFFLVERGRSRTHGGVREERSDEAIQFPRPPIGSRRCARDDGVQGDGIA